MLDSDSYFAYLHPRNYLINVLGRRLYSAGMDRGAYIEVYQIDRDVEAMTNPYIDRSIDGYWRVLLPEDYSLEIEDRVWTGVAKTPQEASKVARGIVDSLLKDRNIPMSRPYKQGRENDMFDAIRRINGELDGPYPSPSFEDTEDQQGREDQPWYDPATAGDDDSTEDDDSNDGTPIYDYP